MTNQIQDFRVDSVFYLYIPDSAIGLQGWADFKRNARIKGLQHGSALWEERKIR